jgi:hypothetical protein
MLGHDLAHDAVGSYDLEYVQTFDDSGRQRTPAAFRLGAGIPGHLAIGGSDGDDAFNSMIPRMDCLVPRRLADMLRVPDWVNSLDER